MAQKILNGGFLANLNDWSNTGAEPFVWYSGAARASSYIDSDAPASHRLTQYFSVSGTAILANITVRIYWNIVNRANLGSVSFALSLIKPDTTVVSLGSVTKDAAGSGTELLVNAADILASVDQVGEYGVQLEIDAASSWYVPIDDPVYSLSTGDFDEISVVMNERFSKVILETLGGVEITKGYVSPTVLEVAGLHEDLASIGGGPGSLARFERFGVQEYMRADVAAPVLEACGLTESLERTYTYRQRDLPNMPDKAVMRESLVARYQIGNLTQEVVLAGGDIDIWTDIAPAVTAWEA